ncbi:PQQ-binding-like beta-propeller repeat protein [Stieleria varia]|nr:PQQ-binding-like beta-propeller repeat protein [Stieleria varia]
MIRFVQFRFVQFRFVQCSVLLAMIAIALPCQHHLSAQDAVNTGRFWTTKSGIRSKVLLVLIDQTDDAVKLRRQDNGQVVTMKREQLSDADLRYLDTITAKSEQMSAAEVARPDSSLTTDWPQWRGANRDGISPETGLLKQWPSGGPERVWTVSGIGEGYSTPTVVGDRVYVLGTEGDSEQLIALEQSTGERVRSMRLGSVAGGGGYRGPRSSPTVDGNQIFALGSDGTLACFSRADGELVWQKNLKTDFNGQEGDWSYAESPLVDGEKVICTPGGDRATMVALNRNTGAMIWSGSAAELPGNYSTAGYASAIKASLAGQPQYLTFLNGGVVGFSAKDGKPLWHYDSAANVTANCSTPVTQGDFVFAASGYGTGGGKARISRRGTIWAVEEAYFVTKMQNHHGGFVLVDGHLYGTNDSVLLCINWETGDIAWQDRCVGKGSIAYADGHLYVRGENGEVALVVASPDGYQEVGRFDQPDRSDKNAWPHPVIAAGKLYLHDWDRIFCYSIR